MQPALQEQSIVHMESTALAWFRAGVVYYQVFVDECDKFDAILCVPYDVKFDPILITPENMNELCCKENANITEIK